MKCEVDFLLLGCVGTVAGTVSESGIKYISKKASHNIQYPIIYNVYHMQNVLYTMVSRLDI